MVNARKITNAESGNPFMLMEGIISQQDSQNKL